jgi:hypothetical protein
MVMDGSVMDLSLKTLELPDLGNQQNISCIPEGVYDVVKSSNPEHGQFLSVLNVPNRIDICIHKGNFTRDTKGCILVGMFFMDIDGNGTMDVGDTKRALDKLLGYIPDKIKLYVL